MFTNPVNFNDPFEYLPTLQNKNASSQDITQNYALNSFIFCMTKEEYNVRMWDHYGDKHKGLMISLDFQGALAEFRDNWILPVDYSRTVRCEPLDASLSPQGNAKRFKDIVTHKGKDWEHEFEYRWILPAQNCNPKGIEGLLGELGEVDGKRKAFLSIPASGILKVTVGYHSSRALLDRVLKLRSHHNTRWKVAKAKLSPSTFKFEDEWIRTEYLKFFHSAKLFQYHRQTRKADDCIWSSASKHD